MMRYPPFIANDMPFPPFLHVQLRPAQQRLADVPAAVRAALAAVLTGGPIRAGDRVAVAVGSRGIAALVPMVRTVVAELRRHGADPFIVPAMGSHGGATAAGQSAVLARLGVTAESCGAPVRASMETVVVGQARGEVPVHFDREALTADHTVCLNRIKPHTKFKGSVGSGIQKMLCVGLGKHDGAIAYHKWALKYGFEPLLEAMARVLAARSNFRWALAVVENAYDEPCQIEAVTAERMWRREPELLAEAQRHFPRLPFAALDALVIQQIGKEISGAGMDPNVTGRACDLQESDFSATLQATRLAVLDLSPHTAGNAIGLGLADFITEKVFQAMDYEATLMNALTSLSLRKAFIPLRLSTERQVIQACFTTLGPVDPQSLRVAIIRDTRTLLEFLASKALEPRLAAMPQAALLGEGPLRFDAAGRLQPPWPR
jgi:hypothetical protein